MYKRLAFAALSLLCMFSGAVLIAAALGALSAQYLHSWHVLPLLFVGGLLFYLGNELVN